MKILIIQTWIRQGGAENLSVYLAYHLQHAGHEVKTATLFTDLTNSPPEAHRLKYVTPSKRLADLCKNRYFIYFFGTPILFWVVLRSSRGTDVINAHNPPASWIAILIGKMRGIPVVWTCNEFAEQALPRPVGLTVGRLLDRVLMRYADEIIVLSRKTQRMVKERFGKEAKLIRAGIDPIFFELSLSSRTDPAVSPETAGEVRDLAKRKIRPSTSSGLEMTYKGVIERHNLKNKFILLTVGKIHRQKNQIVCLEALKKILPEIPEAVLVITGEGPLKKFLEEKTREWGLEDHVRFVGFVSNEELRDLYYACDVNLFSALDQSWGLTPFEALGAKKISIVSEDSGAAEILQDENTGLVCSPTPEAFAEKILEIHRADPARRAGRAKERSQGTFRDRLDFDPGTEELGSKELARGKFQKMTLRGHQYVKQNLSWKSYANRTLEVLRKTCGRLDKSPSL